MKCLQFRYLSLMVAVLCCCTVPAFANMPLYKEYRDWIIEKSDSDAKIPKDQRIFVGYSNEWASIQSFAKGLDIRTLLDQTKAKGQTVGIMVLRAGNDKPVFSAKVGPNDRPVFELQPLDVVCLFDPNAAF